MKVMVKRDAVSNVMFMGTTAVRNSCGDIKKKIGQRGGNVQRERIVFMLLYFLQ